MGSDWILENNCLTYTEWWHSIDEENAEQFVSIGRTSRVMLVPNPPCLFCGEYWSNWSNWSNWLHFSFLHDVNLVIRGDYWRGTGYGIVWVLIRRISIRSHTMKVWRRSPNLGNLFTPCFSRFWLEITKNVSWKADLLRIRFHSLKEGLSKSSTFPHSLSINKRISPSNIQTFGGDNLCD
jgi:hypothetical protein